MNDAKHLAKVTYARQTYELQFNLGLPKTNTARSGRVEFEPPCKYITLITEPHSLISKECYIVKNSNGSQFWSSQSNTTLGNEGLVNGHFPNLSIPPYFAQGNFCNPLYCYYGNFSFCFFHSLNPEAYQ